MGEREHHSKSVRNSDIGKLSTAMPISAISAGYGGAHRLRLAATAQESRSEVRRRQEMKSWYLLLMLTAACGIAHASPDARAFEFAQGVIVDPAHSIIYMSNAEARIDAVSLSNGEVIASSARRAKPLLLYDDVLLGSAQERSDALSVVGLTATDLKPKFALQLPLPARAEEGSFYAGARMAGNEIIVHWRSIRRPVSGVPTHEPAVVMTGFGRIDPATGHLIAVAEGEPPAPPAPQEIPAAAQKLADEGRLASPLCPAGELVVALQQAEENGRGQMTLQRWRKDTGDSLPAVTLFGGDFTFRSFSRDCRHLLASKPSERWLWQIYLSLSGELLAQIRNPLPGPEFFVSVGNLIYQAPAVGDSIGGRIRIDPPMLVALNLQDGRKLWERPIGEMTYVGPYPGNPPQLPGRPPGGRK
jgi:hypothetical protein